SSGPGGTPVAVLSSARSGAPRFDGGSSAGNGTAWPETAGRTSPGRGGGEQVRRGGCGVPGERLPHRRRAVPRTGESTRGDHRRAGPRTPPARPVQGRPEPKRARPGPRRSTPNGRGRPFPEPDAPPGRGLLASPHDRDDGPRGAGAVRAGRLWPAAGAALFIGAGAVLWATGSTDVRLSADGGAPHPLWRILRPVALAMAAARLLPPVAPDGADRPIRAALRGRRTGAEAVALLACLAGFVAAGSGPGVLEVAYGL